VKLQPVLLSQTGNQALIRFRLCTSQLVIEMDHGQNNAKLLAQIEEQAKQGDRVGAA
jgi:hypothetical protein